MEICNALKWNRGENTHYEQALSQRYGITVIADPC